MKKWSFRDSNVMILAQRILMVYIALMLCRIVFFIVNHDFLGGIDGEGWSLLNGALVFDTVSVCYAFGLFVVISLLPIKLRERKWYYRVLFWYFAIVLVVVIVINLSDVVYFKYTQKRFTAEEFHFLSNDNTGLVVGKFLIENWYLLLVAAAIYVPALWYFRRLGRPKSNMGNIWMFLGVNTLILAAAIVIIIGGIRGGFKRTVRPITLSNATLYTKSVTKSNLLLSNPFCIVRTLGQGKLSYVKYFDREKLDSIYTPYHYPTGEFAHDLGRRNVVIFIMESFSAEHSAQLNPDLYPDGQGFTPFLDSLMRAGYYFPRGYANGRKSIEAMPSVFASIPSYKTPFVLMPQAIGPSRALPEILSDMGYGTSFFCGSPHGSMGFGAYANAIGVKELYSQETFEAERGKGEFDGFWGIWDEPFLSYVGTTLDKMKQPFYASIFTLSSHHPFVVPDKYKDELPDGKTLIHKGISYTDLALRNFFEQSKDQPWFQNTIFVFSADHVSSETWAPKTRLPLGNSHITLFMYTPDGALQGKHPHVAQQIDVMPTLLGLLGYEKPYFAFGRDIFNETDGGTPVVVNYRDQRFQAITDDYTFYFDEYEPISIYMSSDELLEHDILDEMRDSLPDLLDRVKAIIQQYYTHVEERNYLVK